MFGRAADVVQVVLGTVFPDVGGQGSSVYPMMEPTGALMSWVTVSINFSRETKRSSALSWLFPQPAAVRLLLVMSRHDDEKDNGL